MADIAWDNLIKAILLILPLPFLVTGVIKISREWGVRGTKITACVDGLDVLSEKMDEFTKSVRLDHGEIKRELAHTRQVLTGDEGVNGLRGEVRELHEAFTEKNDADHVRWGEFGLWQLQSDNRLGQIEEHLDIQHVPLVKKRVGPADRRKDPRLVKNDRRKKA